MAFTRWMNAVFEITLEASEVYLLMSVAFTRCRNAVLERTLEA
jgi:hypothetical protein